MTLDPDDAGHEEDLIESDSPSVGSSRIRDRLNRLVPTRVGRQIVTAVAASALALGLGVGYLVGRAADGSGGAQAGLGTPAGAAPLDSMPIIPDGVLQGQGVIVWSAGQGYLRVEDLANLGEIPLPGDYPFDQPAQDHICGVAASTVELPTLPPSIDAENNIDALAFLFADAILTERISPDLDALAASTLRGRVELAQNCVASTGLSVQTDGVQAGIGDEFAVLTVVGADPTTGEIESSLVVIVRVGGHLIEITLAPNGGSDVPNGLDRVLAIARAAVARMLAG